MTDKPSAHELILEVFREKSSLKQEICSRTNTVFGWIKDFAADREQVYAKEMGEVDQRVTFSFEANGNSEIRLQFGGDVLLFHQHSNIFKLPDEHELWKTDYITEDPDRAYLGIINVYNFLADSFRYNRVNDAGYLVARIFVNKDFHFMVEGKRQLGFLYNDLTAMEITREQVCDVVESSILYALDFDLLVPPYENMQMVSIQQMKNLTTNSELSTGKRLGFRFSADQDTIE